MSAATLSGPNASRSMTPAMRASRVLGWVSLAIGAAELLAPKKVARAVGVDENRSGLLRAYGAREVVAGIGAHSVNPVPALWSRVAGDIVDLATIAATARRREGGGRDGRAWIAIVAVAGIAVADTLVAARMTSETREGKGEAKDYSSRTGFPKGVDAARGAGIVRQAFAGKAGGAAAGDSSPAGQAGSGRTVTDLAGAPSDAQAPAEAVDGPASSDKPEGGSAGGGAVGGGATMPAEAREAVPHPVGYTPA